MENYPFLNEALIAVVKNLRLQAGLSQQKLAERAGMDRLYILQMERGRFRPTLTSIFFLARGLGVPPEEFVRLVEEQRQRLERGETA